MLHSTFGERAIESFGKWYPYISIDTEYFHTISRRNHRPILLHDRVESLPWDTVVVDEDPYDPLTLYIVADPPLCRGRDVKIIGNPELKRFTINALYLDSLHSLSFYGFEFVNLVGCSAHNIAFVDCDSVCLNGTTVTFTDTRNNIQS